MRLLAMSLQMMPSLAKPKRFLNDSNVGERRIVRCDACESAPRLFTAQRDVLYLIDNKSFYKNRMICGDNTAASRQGRLSRVSQLRTAWNCKVRMLPMVEWRRRVVRP